MTKHRTIIGFAAVALLTVAATAATTRSHSRWSDGMDVSAGTMLLKSLTVVVNKPPTADFDERWSAMFALAPTTDAAQRGLGVR
jgi:hypothetical protein